MYNDPCTHCTLLCDFMIYHRNVHSQVSVQVLVLAVQMESAYSALLLLLAHRLNNVWQAPRQIFHATTPKGTCIQAHSSEHRRG